MKETRGVVAVTGASRGIGAAVAIELANAGFHVAAMSRGGTGVEAVPESSDAPSDGSHITGVQCDVSDEGSVRGAFGKIAELGSLSGLVCNAGVFEAARSHELDASGFDAIMQTNARGCFLTCREAFPHMKNSGGTIVNIGSFYDRLGVPGGLAYCASKAAVGAITRCLAVEWARHNIRVVNVAPGFIATDLNADLPEKVRESIRVRIPSGEFGAPVDVARLVRSLIADAIPYLTGETIYIDGAQGLKE